MHKKEAQLLIAAATWERDGAALRALRQAVFVAEQSVPLEIELDGRDAQCRHLLAWCDSDPVGCVRMLPDGHIGRMAVLAPHRGRGIGRRLLAAMLEEAAAAGLPEVWLHAQVHAIAFYEGLGFRAEGAEFDEAGIRHRLMRRELRPAAVSPRAGSSG